MVKLRTTTSMTPRQVHQVGLDAVERIHREMNAVMEQVRFDGDLKEFFEFLNTDDQFDVKEFHTEVLIDEPLPLELLETKIDRWIEAQQS